jgi:DNA-directed RNA polymerase specialized sigma24 family protein
MAFERLRLESERKYAALSAYVNEQLTYEALAARLGRSVSDIRNDLHGAKVRLRKHIEALILEYTSSEAECRDELAYLLQFMP